MFLTFKICIQSRVTALENFVNNKMIICQSASQPDHKNRPTAYKPVDMYMASILRPGDRYIGGIEPFLHQ